jgi:hypothetical protein
LPKPGGSLLIGTLSKFRTDENTYIKDSEEGSFSISVSFQEPTEVPLKWFHDVTFGTSLSAMGSDPYANNYNFSMSNVTGETWFQGAISQGKIKTKTHSASFLGHISEKIRVVGSIDLEYRCEDAWVFCMSLGRDVGSVIRDPEYNSIWSLPLQNLRDFCGDLARLIDRYIKSGNLWCDIPMSIVGSKEAEVLRSGNFLLQYRHEIVRYLPRTISAGEHSRPSQVALKEKFDFSPFIKPLSFQSELEYRFYVRPVLDFKKFRRVFPLRLRPISLPFDEILRHIV